MIEKLGYAELNPAKAPTAPNFDVFDLVPDKTASIEITKQYQQETGIMSWVTNGSRQQQRLRGRPLGEGFGGELRLIFRDINADCL